MALSGDMAGRIGLMIDASDSEKKYPDIFNITDGLKIIGARHGENTRQVGPCQALQGFYEFLLPKPLPTVHPFPAVTPNHTLDLSEMQSASPFAGAQSIPWDYFRYSQLSFMMSMAFQLRHLLKHLPSILFSCLFEFDRRSQRRWYPSLPGTISELQKSFVSKDPMPAE